MLLANTTLASSQRSISSGYQARYRASGRSSRGNLRGTGVKSLRSLPEKELRSTGDYRTCVRSMERMEVRSSRGKACERDASTKPLRKQARHKASGKKRNVTRSNWLQKRRNREEPARRELRGIFAVENRFLEIVSHETLFATAPGYRWRDDRVFAKFPRFGWENWVGVAFHLGIQWATISMLLCSTYYY